ncbi:MAG: phosphate ABC transporter substrate-binding protein PstS [Hyphomonadaceae bacterium]
MIQSAVIQLAGRLATAFAAAALFAAPALAQDMTGAGATFPAPIYSSWGEDYAKVSGGRLNDQALGSGAGVTQIVNRTVDFGASDSPVAAEKLEKEKLLQFPAVIGAVVLVVNIPGVDGTKVRLTGELVGEIFVGRIRLWNDPKITAINPGLKLPQIPISPAYRADSSGTTSIFTKYVSSVSPIFKERTGAGNSVAWRTGLGAPGNAGVAAAVKNIKGGIGYVEFAYAAENGMQALMLANKDGKFVSPSIPAFLAAASHADWANAKNMAATMQNMPGETSWPIVSSTYILVPRDPKDPVRTQHVLQFFDWSYRNGGPTADRLHYIMLPPNVQDLARQQWATLSANGKPLWPPATN